MHGSWLLPRAWEGREHLPPRRVLAWHLSLLHPPAVSVSTDLGHLDGPARGKEPALGKAGGSSITAALSSHPVAARSQPSLPRSQLKLHPSSSSSQLITRHVLVAFAEAVARWCVIRPCLRAGRSSNLAPLHLWSCLKHSCLKHSFSKLPRLQGKEHAVILQSTWQTGPARSHLPPQSLHLSWTVQLGG